MKEYISTKKAGICGIIAPIVVFSLIAVSISIHPWFNFTANALSDLGAFGTDYLILFSLSLIISGFLLFFFSVRLGDLANCKIGSVGSNIFSFGTLLMILVGLFPKGSTVHMYIGIFMGISYFFGIILIGVDQFMEKSTRPWSFFIFSTMILTIFGIVFVSLTPRVTGFAIPETLSILFLSNFSMIFGFRILKHL